MRRFTLDEAVTFANFCKDQNVSPYRVQTAIEAVHDLWQIKGSYARSQKQQGKIAGILKELGFTDVTFHESLEAMVKMYPTFTDSFGDRNTLPFTKTTDRG